MTILRNIKLREVHVRWIGIPLMGLLMTFVHEREVGESLLQKYIVATTFTLVFWNGAFTIFMFFRRKFPQIRQTPRRLILTVITLIVFMTIGDPLLCLIFNYKTWQEVTNPAIVFDHAVINYAAAFGIGSIYENVYFFEQWKKSIQLNEALKNQQVRTQFEVLQNQMSPHFLFNSLNTLTTLISEDGKIAIEFTEKLSEVYRYILQNKDKEVVRLSEELEFAKSYIFLLKIRYPENLHTHFNVDESHLSQSIAPLTIQILLENAIKHNRISKSHPLQIDIYVDRNNNIVVKNNLQKKNVIEKSTKTGLSNIRKRYAYFGQHDIAVASGNGNFLVSVPLLNIKKEAHKLMAPGV
ncbi:MAG: histidine kinase [Bacteroidota bacterium]